MTKLTETRITRRQFNVLLASAAAADALPGFSAAAAAQTHHSMPVFVHPGMLHTHEDLERMRIAVRQRQEPIFSGFEKLRAHPLSQLSYRSEGASAEIGRNPNVRFRVFDSDSNAAYQCAILWCVTQDRAYAEQSIGLMDAWSAELRTISGADAVLCAALGGFKMANAAELMRHMEAGWPADRVERFNQMLRSVFLAVIINFAAFANGNWDTAAMKMMMAIAVFGDDRTLLDRAVTYYGHGCGDGRIIHYIYPSGQCQESGRDQQHTQLGLGHMGDCCEVAWSQGLDLYAAVENRLLTGFEYTAKYILGGEVPFTPDEDRTGKYRHEVISPRSPLRPVYEQIWNHYVQRRGLAAPWTEKAAAQLRPAGAGPGADQTGFGTLLYTRPRNTSPVKAEQGEAPAAAYATPAQDGIAVEFTPLAAQAGATIRRSEAGKGYRVIARDVQAGSYRDSSAAAGHLYTYSIAGRRSSALPAASMSAWSLPATVMAGLPGGWRLQAVEKLPPGSAAACDGSTFRLTAAGGDRIDQGGGYAFLHRNAPGDVVLIARILPLFASQFLQGGIAIVNGAAEHLLLMQPTADFGERPVWSVCWAERGGKLPAKQIASQRLPAPTVQYGRIMRPIWLALENRGAAIRAGFSLDGVHWTSLGSVTDSAGSSRAGLVLNSGIGVVTTELCFDSVSLRQPGGGSVLDVALRATTRT